MNLITAALVAFFALRMCRFVQNHMLMQYVWAFGVDLAALGALTLFLPDLAALRLLVWGLSLSLLIFSTGIFLRVRQLLGDPPLCLWPKRVKALPRRYLRSGHSTALRIQRTTFPGLLPTWAYLSAVARGRVYVRCVDGLPVALAVVERLPGVNWLSYLAVDSNHRRQGHARALLSELGSLALTVRTDNAEAIALYLAVGFVQVARWPHYYGHFQAGDVFVRAEWKNYSEF